MVDSPGDDTTGGDGSSGSLGGLALGLFWISFKAIFLGSIYYLYNTFVTALTGWLRPLLADALDWPEIDFTYGAALYWFNIANQWVPITEAIVMWTALWTAAIIWVPIKAAVNYFVPTVNSG